MQTRLQQACPKWLKSVVLPQLPEANCLSTGLAKDFAGEEVRQLTEWHCSFLGRIPLGCSPSLLFQGGLHEPLNGFWAIHASALFQLLLSHFLRTPIFTVNPVEAMVLATWSGFSSPLALKVQHGARLAVLPCFAACRCCLPLGSPF